MPDTQFFPQRPPAHPIIYAYSDTRFPGCLKVRPVACVFPAERKEAMNLRADP